MPAEHAAARIPASRIPRCAEGAWGYDVAEVDAFLARVRKTLEAPDPAPGEGCALLLSTQVRAAVFSGARGGYRPEAVDEALDAAEDALAAAEREQVLRLRGPEVWRQHVDALTGLLRGRIERPRTQRFRHPGRSRGQGYSAAHVDVLCERLGARLTDSAPLDPAELRGAVFPLAHGERSYEEQQVDAFLDRAVQLLLALR
ncbi:DivIVA domain-containing protein [Kocuria turfanensis]|uniref:DivIVA domain-containing protein n=1 Tax=Kocuria turfanensis TaxID=388357 RepID=A0A512IAL0_9MICC|nr:DivIVA domain-containing protein [Kocuria turfanensis]GEO94729.1 DivIVA domain-containing protein [Kocuria turfanensis]